MSEVKLSLSTEEVNAILSVLGDLPTKTGAWGLLMKIKLQSEKGLQEPIIANEAQELNGHVN